MTIAAGFRCYDGVVLCTDSEHTVGQSKFYQKKIFQAEACNALVYLAGAGHDDYIKSTAEGIEAAIKDKVVSLDQIKVAAQAVVSGLYRDHFAPSRQVNDPNAPSMSLLLAVKVNDYGIKPEAADGVLKELGDSYKDAAELSKLKEALGKRVADYRPGEPTAMLYRLAETGGISSPDSDTEIIVTGSEASETLMREMAGLFLPLHMSVYTTRLLAIHMIHRATRFASYCGGRAQVAALTHDGAHYLDNEASSDPGQDWLAEILRDVRDIVESCLSGNTDLFESASKWFEETARKELEKRKSELGHHDPSEVNGWSR
jgi:hypothetical protein